MFLVNTCVVFSLSLYSSDSLFPILDIFVPNFSDAMNLLKIQQTLLQGNPYPALQTLNIIVANVVNLVFTFIRTY